MSGKFFATIIAADRAALVRLGSYELDLLHQTAAVTERRTARLSSARDKTNAAEVGPPTVVEETTIEGLLTLAEVGRLVGDGYQVLVRESVEKRSRAKQTMEFQDWLKVVTEG